MLGPHFYNEAIRKTVIGFGTLFNNIEIRKKDPSTGTVIEAEKVPLAYGPKQKFLARLEQNPDVDKKIAITLPRLYFEMTNISYDTSRKITATQKLKKTIDADGESLSVQYVPVPYNMEFELGIIAKSQDDGLQILEQILPFFQPNFNITLNMIPDMGEKKDVTINLNNINYEDDWDGDFLDRRSIVWTLNFTLLDLTSTVLSPSLVLSRRQQLSKQLETRMDLQRTDIHNLHIHPRHWKTRTRMVLSMHKTTHLSSVQTTLDLTRVLICYERI